MELDELGIDIEAQNCLDQIQQESWTSADYDPSQGMTGEELHNFCKFLYSQIQSKDEEISRLTANIKELTDEVRLSRLQQQTYNDENKAVSASHSHKLDVVLQQLQETRQELTDTKRKLKTAETLLADAKEKNRQLEAEREKDAKERKDLENDIALLRSDLYSGTKSQQSGRSAEDVGANDGRDDFDGTDASLPEANRKDDVSSEANSDGEKSEKSQSGEPNNSSEDRDSSKGTPGTPTPKTIYHGPSRKGRTYNKHTVGTPIIHKCDLSHLPEGVTYHIKKNPKKVLHTITKVEEHWFEEVVLTYPDGHKETYFMPQENDKDGYLYDEIVPGTHVTSDFLTEETSNMYDMACPAYREVKNRLSEMGLKTHRQNLANYADKGYEILKLVLPALKDRALAPGSNVNVDETWERFQTHFGHRKTYMWCLVNRKANIVIFFYEDTVDKYGNQKSGGRNRAVLKDFLGDAKLKSLQSDGYICYMYLDDDLIDIEHLCCLAHVRAKLERAERMGCKEASSPMSKIRKLYKREDLYVEKGYAAEKIIFGEENLTNGSESDIEKATHLVCGLLKNSGFGQLPAAFQQEHPDTNLYLTDTNHLLNEKAGEIIKSGLKKAEQTLNEQKQLLLKMSDHLADNRCLQKEQIVQLFKDFSVGVNLSEIEKNGSSNLYRNLLKQQLNSAEPKIDEFVSQVEGIGYSLNNKQNKKVTQ